MQRVAIVSIHEIKILCFEKCIYRTSVIGRFILRLLIFATLHIIKIINSIFQRNAMKVLPTSRNLLISYLVCLEVSC